MQDKKKKLRKQSHLMSHSERIPKIPRNKPTVMAKDLDTENYEYFSISVKE